MESIYNHTCYTGPQSLAEFEGILVPIVKLVDSPNKLVRGSFSFLISEILALSQQKYTPKTNAKKGKEDETADRTILTIEEMLSFLPRLYLKATNPEACVTVIQAFATLLRKFGIQFAETNYSLICNVCIDLASNTKLQNSKNEYYVAKESTSFLLRDVVGKLSSEAGQLRACRELMARLVKHAETPLNEVALACILRELGSLLADLGPAVLSIQDEIVEPLMELLDHPNYVVKLSLASCLRDLCLALPHHITKIMNRIVVALQKDLGAMTSENLETIERVVGYGHILSAVIGIISYRPLFAAYEDSATILGLATQLLKSHFSAKDYRVMASQAQIGWTLIGSLMSLGPHFVKVHVSQLLLIWKNVFPKTQPKDAVINRSELEWGYLLYSRDAALAALISFITFNAKELITADVGKRIMVCLNNTLQFLSTLSGAYGPIDDKPASPTQFKLYERECLLRARLFKCFRILAPASIYEAIYIPVLKAAVESFAMDPDRSDRFTATLGTKDGALFGTLGGKDTGALFIESVHSTSLAVASIITVATESGAEDRSISKVSICDAQIKALDNLVCYILIRSIKMFTLPWSMMRIYCTCSILIKSQEPKMFLH